MGEQVANSGSPDVSEEYKQDPEVGRGEGTAGGAADASGFGCMAITRTALRGTEFVLALICFSCVAASNGVTYSSWGVTYKAGTLGVPSVAFLLAMGIIACIYALVAAVLLVVAILRPSSELTYRLPRPLLITDFVILLLLFAASCSVGADFQACGTGGGSVCGMVQAGAAMGFLASFCFMADFWLTLIPVFVEI